jgi:late competence protein required for DNA uptake (superfamily II DNA/RNA helicase)
VLIEHRTSHLTQGSIFPFHNTILGRRIQTQKLMFKTQVMAKGFEARLSEFRAIITANRSYSISVPLVPQPQDKISNKTKRLPFLLKKEHPRIPIVVVHHNKNIPLPTRRSHTSWTNKVHMEQLAWTLSHHISERRVRRGYHLGMPTWRTNQLFLKPQPWQSSDQIEFAQARQNVKAQVT